MYRHEDDLVDQYYFLHVSCFCSATIILVLLFRCRWLAREGGPVTSSDKTLLVAAWLEYACDYIRFIAFLSDHGGHACYVASCFFEVLQRYVFRLACVERVMLLEQSTGEANLASKLLRYANLLTLLCLGAPAIQAYGMWCDSDLAWLASTVWSFIACIIMSVLSLLTTFILVRSMSQVIQVLHQASAQQRDRLAVCKKMGILRAVVVWTCLSDVIYYGVLTLAQSGAIGSWNIDIGTDTSRLVEVVLELTWSWPIIVDLASLVLLVRIFDTMELSFTDEELRILAAASVSSQTACSDVGVQIQFRGHAFFSAVGALSRGILLAEKSTAVASYEAGPFAT